MKKLRESGYIEMDKDGFISLLPSGEEIARRIYERHKLLTQFFIRLGVDPEVAAADACKVEHDQMCIRDRPYTAHGRNGGGRKAFPPISSTSSGEPLAWN